MDPQDLVVLTHTGLGNILAFLFILLICLICLRVFVIYKGKTFCPSMFNVSRFYFYFYFCPYNIPNVYLFVCLFIFLKKNKNK